MLARTPLTLLCALGAFADLTRFNKIQRTVLPWLKPLATLPLSDPAALAQACLSHNFSLGVSLPPCAWSPPLSNQYLAGCAPPASASSVPNCINFPTLAEAQARCVADPRCGGVTSQDGGGPPWELRVGPNPVSSPLGEVTYQLLNPAQCHPAPPPPPASLGACNAFATSGALYHCPGGRCDCDGGGDACARGRDIFSEDPAVGFGAATTDLWVARGRDPPAPWAAGVAAGDD